MPYGEVKGGVKNSPISLFCLMLGASPGDPTHDKVMWRDLMGKASQVSRGPLPEHLPRNQNLSVYCLLYYTLLTLQGAIPDHLFLEKVNLKLNIQKTKIKASGPITSWEIDGKQRQTLFWGAPKSLQIVNAAMKLKYTPQKKSYDRPR